MSTTFSTFRFFLSLDALSSSRGENLFVSALTVNNFFSAFEKFFSNLSSARRHGALSVLVKLSPRPSAFRFRPAREAFMGSFAPKVKKFFKFFSKKQNPARAGVMSFPFDARRSGIRSRLRACPGGAAPAFGSAARPTDSSRRWSAARAPCRTHSRRWVGPQARPAPDRCSRRG